LYQRIMLPLDSSELAEAAIPHAESIALGQDAAMHLVHVVDRADLRAPILRETLERIGNLEEPDRSAAVDAVREAATTYLEAVAERLRAAGVAEVTIAVIEGNPYSEISAEAQRSGSDLVVIASHGRSGLGRALLGSVADHLIRNTPHAAVLVVPPGDEG
jgi:nucleotide-binding universal stress UspA family protein